MTSVRAMWDFGDPAGSEARFRAAAVGDNRQVMLTQVARALGLQGQYDAGHALLDEVAGDATLGDEARIRVRLERGRLLNSAGRADEARPEFEAAIALAAEAGEEFLHIDAVHMLAIVQPEQAERLLEGALDLAARATDPEARNWDASLLNNLGMAHHAAGDLPAALASFEAALTARLRSGNAGDVRVARWMIAWTLRLLGHTGDALAMQQALKAELDAAGETDPYVDEELSLLTDGDTAGR